MLKIEIFPIGPIQTNCYLAYDSSTKEGVLIDPGIYDESIADFIKTESLDIKFIINTHGHYDHIGGDKKFGYPVLIHKKDSGCFKNPTRSLSFAVSDIFNGVVAHRLLKDKDKIDIMNLTFHVIGTPGHSPGGISLKCNNVLFTGDTLFFEGVGRTDIPFANQKDLMNSIAKLLKYPDETIVYPGHGPSSTIGHERVTNPFI